MMQKKWRLERRLSLPLLLSAAAQFLTIVIWATYLEARVAALEAGQATSRGWPERLARLEERVQAIREDTAFIRSKLSK